MSNSLIEVRVIFIGRLVGVALGWSVGGPIGALVGFGVGYFFDRAFANFQAQFDPEKRAQVQRALFHSVFPMLGHMAKADGRVSEEEIQAAETMMSRMQLTPELRKEAIKLFQQGVAAEFDLAKNVEDFLFVCGPYPDIKQILLVYMITMAMSDGELHPAEEDILKQLGRHLGYSESAYEHILRMAQAQGYFYNHSGYEDGSGQPGVNALQKAYEAIGVSEDVSDAELKKAYRKLMSQYHPDKLVGQGVPENMVKVATERSQEIQAAYDLIKKSRANNEN